MSRVLTVGTFDLPHSGHIALLQKCRKIANLTPYLYSYLTYQNPPREVIVAINYDKFVKQFKGVSPAYPFHERAKVIESFEFVTKVIPNKWNEDLKPLLLEVKPDFLVVGSDWAKKDYYKQTKLSEEWLENLGTTLLYVPYTEGVSSTALKGRICE